MHKSTTHYLFATGLVAWPHAAGRASVSTFEGRHIFKTGYVGAPRNLLKNYQADLLSAEQNSAGVGFS